MFYVKETAGLMEVTIPITSENVYTKCPLCGKEVQVDLEAFFADDNVDLFGSHVVCDDCYKKMKRKEK